MTARSGYLQRLVSRARHELPTVAPSRALPRGWEGRVREEPAAVVKGAVAVPSAPEVAVRLPSPKAVAGPTPPLERALEPSPSAPRALPPAPSAAAGQPEFSAPPEPVKPAFVMESALGTPAPRSRVEPRVNEAAGRAASPSDELGAAPPSPSVAPSAPVLPNTSRAGWRAPMPAPAEAPRIAALHAGLQAALAWVSSPPREEKPEVTPPSSAAAQTRRLDGASARHVASPPGVPLSPRAELNHAETGLHIGTLEIRVQNGEPRPPQPPAPVVVRAAPAAPATLSRGYTNSWGLRQS